MKARLHYVKGHIGSEEQAMQSLASFRRYGWDVELVEGVTPDTIDETEFTSKILGGSRLEDFAAQDYRKFLVKKSCLFNNLRLMVDCVESNESMIFLEHDSICTANYEEFEFDEFCSLSYEYAFKEPTALAKYDWTPISLVKGVLPFCRTHPLQYYKNSIYKGSNMTPGTAAYAISPRGAMKVLDAVERNGIDQSDFLINSDVIKLDYLNPSPIRYANTNLNLSHTL